MAEEPAGRAKESGPDPAGLTAALSGSEASEEARGYLREQTRLARLQAEDIEREDKLRHWSLVMRHTSDVLRLTFELTVAAIGLAILVAIAAAVWSAEHDNSLVIDAFNVPAYMASRGLTGQVVAAQLQDKLSAMQNATDSARLATTYTNNWGDDIKVEIPNTGISIGEFYRDLAAWLGHRTHITGEVFRTDTGIAVTARTGDDVATVTGSATELDKLLQQAAETIYARTQPYRYAAFLRQGNQSQIDRAAALLQKLAVEGAPTDRLWAHIGLSALYARSDPVRSASEARRSAALDPDSVIAQSNIYLSDMTLEHEETALAAAKAGIGLARNARGEITERARTIGELILEAQVAGALDDFASALGYCRQAAMADDYSGVVEAAREQIALELGLLHETTAARSAWRALPAAASREFAAGRAPNDMQLSYWTGDWRDVIAKRTPVERAIENAIGSSGLTRAWADVVLSRDVWPYIATALAMTGDFAAAHALIEKTPLDCYTCVRARGDIAAAEKDWKAADYWFARTVHGGPSLPMGYADWGRVLMEKGDFDGAMAKFKDANAKGPHFADPLEMWGEALIEKNRSDLALAKFEDANKYAPDWGRLHLEWGKALFWSGDKNDARKQFAIAARLDLSQSDKAALAAWTTHHD